VARKTRKSRLIGVRAETEIQSISGKLKSPLIIERGVRCFWMRRKSFAVFGEDELGGLYTQKSRAVVLFTTMSLIRTSIFEIFFDRTCEKGIDLWIIIRTPPPLFEDLRFVRVGWNVLLNDNSRREVFVSESQVSVRKRILRSFWNISM
jgi:hypothetical protein